MTTKLIYLDHAATTYMDEKVFKKMQPYFCQNYGNPSSLYSLARKAKQSIEEAREKVAVHLHCLTEELFFTGSGTESDNWAIKGIAKANKEKGNHIITTAIEHSAVLKTCRYLAEKENFNITYLPVDKMGKVSPQQVKEALTSQTILVSIMYANNEIGTIEPIREIGEILASHQAYFHTDACQAAGALSLDTTKLLVDSMTINGSKIYGPKGVGALFVRKGVKIQNLIQGGGQEFGKRGGTENVPGIVALAEALDLIQKKREKENERLKKLREKIISEIKNKIPQARLNGHSKNRLPNNINFSFAGVEGEALLLQLDEYGICASTGSACSSTSLDPSHVLTAIGLPPELSHGSLRITLGQKNTMEEVNYLTEILPQIIQKIRNISPLDIYNPKYEKYFKE